MKPKQPPVTEPGPREAFRYIFSVVLDAIKGGLDGFNIAQRYLGAGLKAIAPTANGEAYKAGVDFGTAANLAQIDAGDAAAVGTGTTLPRIDHQHAVNTAAAGDIADVAATAAAGSAGTLTRGGHAHKGVHSIEKAAAGDLFGDVTLSEGTGISLTQAAQDIAIAATTGVPTATILPYGGAAAPTGYLLCDGSAVSRTTYAALYTAVADRFGSGNGTTTFNVPDLRGRFMRGWDNAAGRDPNAGTRTAMNAGGATGDNIGSVQADATKPNGLANANDAGHTHSIPNIATGGADSTHTHTTSGNTGSGGTGNTGDANQGFDQWGAGAGAATSWAPFGGTPTQHQHAGPSHTHSMVSTTSTESAGHTHTTVVSNTLGVSAVHTHSLSGDAETRPLNAYVNYIIKT